MLTSVRTPYEFFKLLLLPALTLFLLPALAYVFTAYELRSHDARYAQVMGGHIDQDARIPPPAKEELKAMIAAHPPSQVCGDAAPALARYRDSACERYGFTWQFVAARLAAAWALGVGLVALAGALLLGGVAFLNRRAQYVSFVLGWRALVLISAFEVVVQGVLAVWLSFWMPAVFFEHYSVKLILLIGILAAVGVIAVVVGIFRRPPPDAPLDGELVGEADAPGLWARVRELAGRIGTEPPRQIVAGIDANFFVSEAPLATRAGRLEGRSLYVSLPLLRLLDAAEADAVLAHELAHFRGGDTKNSAALGPKVYRYDLYCQALKDAGFMAPVYYLMRMYRAIFEFALKREKREREFLADRAAAELGSAAELVQALLKVSAYSIYRSRTENALFAHGARYDGAVGIAGHVGSGLAPYSASAQFVEDMQTANVPHPFDSHPSLTERMANVGHHVGHDAYGAVVTRAPQRTWAEDIGTAGQIEARLWGDYEAGFRAAHERDLAYRYVPATAEERAVVEKYFPAVEFPLKKGGAIGLTHAGLHLPEGGEPMSWDELEKAEIDGSTLIIHHPKGNPRGAKTKLKMDGLGKAQQQFKDHFGAYWKRHQVMRQIQGGG